MKGSVLFPVDDNGDNGDNDCKYYYSGSYGDSTGSACARKFSITIKITLTVMIVMVFICNYDCGTW